MTVLRQGLKLNMIKGLYVDRWRPGFHTQEEADELLSFCSQVGVTDLFIHNPRRELATIDWLDNGFDYLEYITASFSRVHLWYSTILLWRKNTPLPGEYPEEILLEDSWRVYLDPLLAKDLLVNELSNLMTRYPRLYGVHLDQLHKLVKTRQEDNITLANSLVAVSRNPSMAVTIENWHSSILIPKFTILNVDNVMALELFLDKVGDGIIFGCYGDNIEQRHSLVKQYYPDKDIIYFSYGVENKETLRSVMI